VSKVTAGAIRICAASMTTARLPPSTIRDAGLRLAAWATSLRPKHEMPLGRAFLSAGV
jgi:hypothetical protein